MVRSLAKVDRYIVSREDESMTVTRNCALEPSRVRLAPMRTKSISASKVFGSADDPLRTVIRSSE